MEAGTFYDDPACSRRPWGPLRDCVGQHRASLISPAECAAWIRVGAGLLHQPGTDGADTFFARPNCRAGGSDFTPGAAFGIGPDIPIGRGFGLGPQASYAFTFHTMDRRRFRLLPLGITLQMP